MLWDWLPFLSLWCIFWSAPNSRRKWPIWILILCRQTSSDSTRASVSSNNDVTVSGGKESSSGVFDDIEKMFNGITNELSELLTLPETVWCHPPSSNLNSLGGNNHCFLKWAPIERFTLWWVMAFVAMATSVASRQRALDAFSYLFKSRPAVSTHANGLWRLSYGADRRRGNTEGRNCSSMK